MDDERVERVAKAICDERGQRGDWSRLIDAATYDEDADDANQELDDYRAEARAAIAAMDADPPLEDVLLSSGLVSDGLPGYDVAIAYHDGEWVVQQNRVTLDEWWPTTVHGTGTTIADAIRAAIAAAQGDE